MGTALSAARSQQSLLGWPNYPAVARPAPLRTVKTGWQEQAVHVVNNSPTPAQDLMPFYDTHLPREVTQVIIEAVKADGAAKLAQAIGVIRSPEVERIAKEIEAISKELAGQVLVGNENFYNLCSTNALIIPAELDNDKTKPQLEEVLPFLFVSELRDMQLLVGLAQDPKLRRETISKRQSYAPTEEANELRARLLEKIKELRSELLRIEHNWEALKLPRKAKNSIASRRTAKRTSISAQMIALYDVDKQISHDIARCFGIRFSPFHPCLHGIDLLHGRKMTFSYHLLDLCESYSHLMHVASVLETNYCRLGGTLFPIEDFDPAVIGKTAAINASFRNMMPLNTGSPSKAGHVNYQPDPATPRITGYPSMLEILLYNLLKNPTRFIEEEKERDFFVDLEIRPDRKFPDVAIATVEDNATGFNVHALFRRAVEEAEKQKENGTINLYPILKRILACKDKPFMFRGFTVGELMDMALLPRLSASYRDTISSGIGLDEANHICQLNGWDIMITNTTTGGALVWIIMGEKEKLDKIIARELGQFIL
ncbi:hypothetical protein A2276_07210 [candidate division WOR-1 bacterium RIFOXYA12_FULL_43_27]|uniref:Uncharacterized protein n=1 Tax=candidate division WOR-1 bacterium RIFOXYC2_FULL_46_14 TaxID=1802587 RepID=A0A1F4U7G8_UNCSA|nr:MAG: hypothetical protein A2276_07210 [candidate division WOR-1 bacterium RIFOXYA12_FULL_43_27]OGC20397.1 MAG: hypothetical protein A2292_05035 [candidate division WOR-1 bacterium RIFOXYB2_FULL_46_45]OGC31866.1 MAG: hypothetical protein A2232_06415 [candidate division WOR-1 bacterium RIFOXYA2_FULL_46_56]OGC40243.1 MAG: hypothetical protein A2438_03055 [candidate division WOR-1 bacterium RIFOXYC2_FULL_46_14]